MFKRIHLKFFNPLTKNYNSMKVNKSLAWLLIAGLYFCTACKEQNPVNENAEASIQSEAEKFFHLSQSSEAIYLLGDVNTKSGKEHTNP
jgi:hypothetical protein